MKPKSQKLRGVRLSSRIHWYILSRVSIIMYKNVNYILALINSPHLCITYLSLSCLINFFGGKPFFSVWSVLVVIAMDKRPFSLLWHFCLFMIHSFLFIYFYYYYYYYYCYYYYYYYFSG